MQNLKMKNDIKKLRDQIVIDCINYWRENKKEQKEAILKLLSIYRKHYSIMENKVAKTEPFYALKLFLDMNKPSSERINTLISSL